jgi:hypothetical protein
MLLAACVLLAIGSASSLRRPAPKRGKPRDRSPRFEQTAALLPFREPKPSGTPVADGVLEHSALNERPHDGDHPLVEGSHYHG